MRIEELEAEGLKIAEANAARVRKHDEQLAAARAEQAARDRQAAINAASSVGREAAATFARAEGEMLAIEASMVGLVTAVAVSASRWDAALAEAVTAHRLMVEAGIPTDRPAYARGALRLPDAQSQSDAAWKLLPGWVRSDFIETRVQKFKPGPNN